MSDDNNNHNHLRPKDRRKEPRFEASGVGELITLDSSGSAALQLTAQVLDVSRSGFQLKMDKSVERGTNIKLYLGEVIILGKVANCQLYGENHYAVGIMVSEVIDHAKKIEHLSEADLKLYWIGNGLADGWIGSGLSDAQRRLYQAHLELCGASSCRNRNNFEQTRNQNGLNLTPRPFDTSLMV